MKQIRVHIKGRVQGVFFREFTRREAEQLDLGGWVRNMPDGTVQASFCGRDENVDRMVQWLHIGSPQSQVTSVTVNETPEEDIYQDFRILI